MSGWKRILAWLIDWLWILLGLVGVLIFGLLFRTWEWDLSRFQWNVVAFLLTVLPVTLWLAWSEAGPRRATPGKRRLGLEVVDAEDGTPVPFGRTLMRNTVKVAVPWQLGHTVAFAFATGDVSTGVPGWLISVTVVTYALMIWFVATLFIGSHRTPYDRLSRTKVISDKW